MNEEDLGGDPPCWAHLLQDDADETLPDAAALVVDLGVAVGSGGAIWSLPHGGDLDANLVRLDAGGGIQDHVNNDVDVMVIVQSGTAELTINGQAIQLGTDHLALIPKGLPRSIAAGAEGVAYLSIHRRRSPLGITGRDQAD